MARLDALRISVPLEVEGLEDLVRRLIREELDARQASEDHGVLQAVKREHGSLPKQKDPTPRITIQKDGRLTWNDAAHEVLGRPERVMVTYGTEVLQIFPSPYRDAVPVLDENRNSTTCGPNWRARLARPLELQRDIRRPARTIVDMRGVLGLEIPVKELRR